MCGIVGVLSRDPLAADYPLAAMRDTLAHRGPDDAGVWWSDDRRIGVASRRLAIVDLSAAGRQPMISASGRTVIVFNGAIYNYRDLRAELEARGRRFRTATDTEVILEGYEQWGAGVLERLNGMFAVALVDVTARVVTLARDRVGEKPLYVGEFANRIVFGSELKALLADPDAPRVIDREALEYFLAYGYVPGDRCLLRGFQKIPAAHAMSIEIDTGNQRRRPFWRLPAPPAIEESAGELEQRLESLLHDAVRRQLIADVPVGVLLSGGLDSSLVTALAARSSLRVRTFTITFPGHATHDESAHARLVAVHFGTDHTELPAEPAAVGALPELARQFDEPIADSAMVPFYILARLIRRHATVALGGDGGDELFGGYPHYQWLIDLARARRVMPGSARQLASRAAQVLPYGTRGRHHLAGLAGDIGGSIAHVNMYFDAAARADLLQGLGPIAPAAAPEQWRSSVAADIADPRHRAMRTDFQTTLADGYLVKVDRASMLASLEVRAPFLDHRLVELALGRVPADLAVTKASRKILLKQLASRLLPPAFDRGRKRGLTMPLAAWFAQGWGRFMADTLRADRDLLHPATVEALIDGQRAGRANHERLFALTMLTLWRREYRVAI
jgi:asparagine synthase (glutamine-hydrolysing)